MRVLLRDDVPGAGRRGDIVEVAGGFARNYLIPNGLALVATAGIADQASAMRRARDLRQARDREAAAAQAALLDGTVITIQARAGSGGRLFGSVGAADVVRVLFEQKGVELDRRQVQLDEPIKELGSFELPVSLYDDVTALVTLEVVTA
jgi:large subunit ribosomal protein L9